MVIPVINSVKVIAVDFDGTLYNRIDKTSYEQASESLKWFRRWGYTVVIYSARANSPESVSWIRSWLTEQKIIFDDVTNVKPVRVTWIIDDRGVTFTDNWIEITAAIKEQTFPWKH